MAESIFRRVTANPTALFNHKTRILDKITKIEAKNEEILENLKKMEKEIDFLNKNCGGK